MLRIFVLRGTVLAPFKSYHVVPDEGEMMALLSLPVLAMSHSAICVCFAALQPVQVPYQRMVSRAKSFFT